MFSDLPEIFHESALIDRFHGFIKGWKTPKMKENEGIRLSIEYRIFYGNHAPVS